jgi:hypothetical protein
VYIKVGVAFGVGVCVSSGVDLICGLSNPTIVCVSTVAVGAIAVIAALSDGRSRSLFATMYPVRVSGIDTFAVRDDTATTNPLPDICPSVYHPPLVCSALSNASHDTNPSS